MNNIIICVKIVINSITIKYLKEERSGKKSVRAVSPDELPEGEHRKTYFSSINR